MAGNAKRAGYTRVVELEFVVELLLLLRFERDPWIIFIGNFLVVETDPGLHYLNICIGLKDTQDLVGSSGSSELSGLK